MTKTARSVIHLAGPLFALFCFSLAQAVFAADITVDLNCSLTNAILAAQSDSEVGGCPAGNGADAIHLSSDITLAAELPQITSDITIEGGGYTISGDNAFRIFYNAEGALTLNRLTLTNGSADYGGAIHNEGILTISDSNFSNNAAEYVGGAIFSAGMLSIIDSRFDNNQATLDGGAIASDGTLNIAGSSFSNNSTSRFGGDGGAIANRGELNIADSSFINNSTSRFGGDGGAIRNLAGQLRVADSTFAGNAADKGGGAIENHGDRDYGNAQLSITGSTFTGNIARLTSGGAISSNDFGALDIANSSFSNNSANLFGGAVSSFGELHIANSTFASNSAKGRAGAILVFSAGTATLAHLTVANNLSNEGGGIFVLHKDTALNLYNSLIFGNDGGDCAGTQLSANVNNLIADGSCDPALSGNPLLGTLVEPEDGSPAYYPLLPDSPAIDAADPDFCTETDQTGTARPQGDGCDIGAYEYMSE